MIIYLDEERSYVSWVTHHRDGFVLDWLRKPTKRHPILHRATCSDIRVSKSKETHWTTARHLKACSLDLAELVVWAQRESDCETAYCEKCAPQTDPEPSSDGNNEHITKLAKQILDYVVEVAVIHLDNHDARYDLTIGDVADCLGKTTGQIASALRRLIQSGHLHLGQDQDIRPESDFRCEHRVFPTSKALKTLPAFERLPMQEIEEELCELTKEFE